jgi:hypothetical protein
VAARPGCRARGDAARALPPARLPAGPARLRASSSAHAPAGEYDPKLVEGWKADPKSGFLGEDRFHPESSKGDRHCAAADSPRSSHSKRPPPLPPARAGQQSTDQQHSTASSKLGTDRPAGWPSPCADDLPPASREPSPPRQRKQINPNSTRQYSWATQRIAELTSELEKAQAKIKVTPSSCRRCCCCRRRGSGGLLAVHWGPRQLTWRPADGGGAELSQDLRGVVKGQQEEVESQVEAYKTTIKELKAERQSHQVACTVRGCGGSAHSSAPAPPPPAALSTLLASWWPLLTPVLCCAAGLRAAAADRLAAHAGKPGAPRLQRPPARGCCRRDAVASADQRAAAK